MANTSQVPAVLNVTIYQGDAWQVDVDCSLDLTGYTITAAVHHKDSDGETELTIDETDLAAGQYSIKLPAAASALLPALWNSWCNILTPPYVDPALPQPRTYIAGRFIVEACE